VSENESSTAQTTPLALMRPIVLARPSGSRSVAALFQTAADGM